MAVVLWHRGDGRGIRVPAEGPVVDVVLLGTVAAVLDHVVAGSLITK